MPTPDELMSSYKELEKINNENNLNKIKLEERLRTLQEEEVKVQLEFEKQGLKPEEVEQKISELTAEAVSELEKCKKILEA